MQEQEYKDEIELMDIFNVIWKKKWLIILPTLLCVIAAGIISFTLPKVWEIDAIIQPSKFLFQTQGGEFRKILPTAPKQIAGQINQKSYNQLIAAELNIDIKNLPELKAENLRDTNLVRVSIRDQEIEKAKLILDSLFNHLKRDLDKKVDVELKGIDTQIKSNEIEKNRIEDEIKTLKNKLKISKQRKIEIEDERSNIRKRIELLENEQLATLKKDNKSESESLGMLLYSNEIQKSLIYHNTLNELLNNKKIEEENLNLAIDNKEKEITQIENTIADLKSKKSRIDYAQLVKEPTSSIYPVSPKKKLNVLIAGILGLMLFTFLAFFLEYIEKNKPKT